MVSKNLIYTCNQFVEYQTEVEGYLIGWKKKLLAEAIQLNILKGEEVIVVSIKHNTGMGTVCNLLVTNSFNTKYQLFTRIT